MAIEFHVGTGQPYATRQAGVDAIASLYGGAGWPAEPVDLVVHGTVTEAYALNVSGFTPTLANPFTIRGYSGRDYDKGMSGYMGITTPYTRFRDITEQGTADRQIIPGDAALSTSLRFSRVHFIEYDIEPYIATITGEILVERCLHTGSLYGIFNPRNGTVISTGGLCIVRDCIADSRILSFFGGAEINGGNVILDNNTVLNGLLVDAAARAYCLTLTSGGLYIRNNIAKRASGLLVDFGASVITPTVMNNNRYSHESGAFQVGGVGYNTLAAWRTAISGEADSTVGDPGIDANGRLLASSACIGAGLDLHADSLNPFANDYDGQARPS